LFRAVDCDTDLVVAKDRQRLAVMEMFNLKKLKEVEGKE
jgi:hypothetical protein